MQLNTCVFFLTTISNDLGKEELLQSVSLLVLVMFDQGSNRIQGA